jgi:hypothetical protein
MSSELILYQTEDGQARVQLRARDGSVWLTQLEIAELFATTKQNVSLHIQNVLKEGELRRDSVVKESLTTAADGKSYRTQLFSLEMILAVGYRVKGPRGIQFRQWATAHLSEYLVKGFALDDERLKGRDQQADYFDELLSRIREIRASEARVYQRVREIFALAVDYQEDDRHTQTFFATMQNKMHYAATGLTAAEIIHRRADADQANMGLTNWAGSRVIKRDVATAKNYLDAKEIDTLNRIVVMFLDQAQFRAERRQDIRMGDWEAFLDKFLHDTELPVLAGAGSVSHQQALERAEEQYDAFAERRRQEAETAAESRYVEDLRNAAKAIDGGIPGPRKKSTGRKAKGGEQR